MRTTIQNIIVGLLFLTTMAGVGWAEEKVADFTAETKEVANEVMVDIYKDILKVKAKYPSLKDFDEKALFENQYGIYSIVYKEAIDETQMKKSTVPFGFGLTIDKVDDTTFADKANNFNFAFPLLGVKFTGYQPARTLRSQLDILPLVNEHGARLSDYQQQFMPLRLSIKTTKDAYKIREPIDFEVTLTNVSNRHMVVKDLSSDTLFFLFGDMTWGTSTNTPAKQKVRTKKNSGNIILKSGESLSLKFQGESFERPRDVEIYCAYRMSIKGVNPSATLRIKVVGDQ
jgi:hypothetical protein